MIKSIFILLVSGLILFSCTIDTVNPDKGSAVKGIYVLKSFVSGSGSSTPQSGDQIIVTRIDDNTAKVVIDYAKPTTLDVMLDSMIITHSGSEYFLTKNFSNANASGKVTGNDLILDLNYNSGAYVHIIAQK